MLRRYLDVGLQGLRYFLLAAIVVPSLVVAGALGLDRSQLVTARLWTAPPTFMLDAGVYGGLDGSPPETEAALMANLLHDLIGTDTFADRVLGGAQPGFKAANGAERASRRQGLRRALVVTTAGSHLLVLTFRTDQPERGVALLTSLIDAFGDRAPTIHFERAPLPAGADLTAARSAVEQTFATLWQKSTLGAATPAPSPAAGSLVALMSDAEGKTILYRNRLAGMVGTTQPEATTLGIPQLRQAVVQVIDPPMATRNSTEALLRLFWVALIATIVAAFALVYLVALRDPRLRSGEEVEARTGIRFLGSTPVLQGH